MTAWGYVAGYGAAMLLVAYWLVAVVRVVRQPTEEEHAQSERARVDHEFFAITAGLADQLTIPEED